MICPADQVIETTTSQTTVTYPAPTTTDGTPPVTTTCAPASGATLPVGIADVTCTATDAVGRQGACVFHIAIKVKPVLLGANILAFGDSITAGEITAPSFLLVVRPELSYPTDLQRLLVPRYVSQMPTVTNCGNPGEHAQEGSKRLRDVLAGDSCDSAGTTGLRTLAGAPYDAVLLLEGTNDLNDDSSNQIAHALEGLRESIRYCKSAGVKQVLLATLPPEFNRTGELVPAMNDEIRALAESEKVVLVDVYTALGGESSTLIGVDGIHPTAAGYQVMADAFFAAIRANFEVPPTGAAFRRRIR